MPAASHNEYQRRYFERTVKRTMVPRDTPYLRRHVAEALRFGGIAPGQRVLEVGCGMGRYTLLLAAAGLQVDALDLSPVLIERLRAYNAQRHPITLHACDLAQCPPALDGAFDAVLGFFVLHHLDSLEACFRGVARLLRPGGRAVFVEPNPFNGLYYAQILLTPGMSFRGERGMLKMRRAPLFTALAAAGLQEPAMERFGFFPPQIANRALGAAVERALERVRPLRPLLPFQLFRATKV